MMNKDDKTIENGVKVLEGDINWMSELRTVLLDAGIPCMLHSDAGRRHGRCGDTVPLMVSPRDFEKAQDTIKDYLMELDPDLRTARELLGKGKCPACGTSIVPDARDCPDCGLPLVVT